MQTKNDELRYRIAVKDQYYIPSLDRMICPYYYTYVEEKLVLIYNRWSDLIIQPQYKNKTKRKLKKLLKPYFDKPEKVVFRDSTGKVISRDKVYIDEAFNLHGGITLWIYADGKTKITTYWDQFKKNKKVD